ncbi:MAG: prepilin-type N-terminal cleavage/methylation domain-containing protein [Patescibacteria group bacterium]
MNSKKNQGFTLIEVVVVMAIIAVLAVLVTGAIGIARRMARDTTRRADLRTLNTALVAFYTKNHRMPQNYHPGYGACEGEAGDYFEKSMQEIVDAGVLKEIPKSPSNTPSGDYRKYCYYDYGTFTTGNPPKRPGAILVTRLEGGRTVNRMGHAGRGALLRVATTQVATLATGVIYRAKISIVFVTNINDFFKIK